MELEEEDRNLLNDITENQSFLQVSLMHKCILMKCYIYNGLYFLIGQF